LSSLKSWSFKDRYTIKVLNDDDFFPLFNSQKDNVFGEDFSCYPRDYYSDNDKEKLAKLKKRMSTDLLTFNLAVFDEANHFVGWSFGFQENQTTFYMCNSGVLKEHRKKGIYSYLLELIIEQCKEEGFQIIYSRHNATNNSILIPKLKAGFVISKFELCDVFGALVHIRYDLHPIRKKIMDVRSGQKAPDQEIKKIMKLI